MLSDFLLTPPERVCKTAWAHRDSLIFSAPHRAIFISVVL